MGYTKGEWAIYPSALDEKDLVIWCKGEFIGTVRNKANARLIASAPLLYEACKGLMDIAEMAMPDTFFASDSRVEQAREALSKANGDA